MNAPHTNVLRTFARLREVVGHLHPQPRSHTPATDILRNLATPLTQWEV
jgi:hypothetical protein